MPPFKSNTLQDRSLFCLHRWCGLLLWIRFSGHDGQLSISVDDQIIFTHLTFSFLNDRKRCYSCL